MGIRVGDRDPSSRFPKQRRQVSRPLCWSEPRNTGRGQAPPPSCWAGLCFPSFLYQREVDKWKGGRHRAARMIRGLKGWTCEIRLKDLSIYHLSELWLGDRQDNHLHIFTGWVQSLGTTELSRQVDAACQQGRRGGGAGARGHAGGWHA